MVRFASLNTGETVNLVNPTAQRAPRCAVRRCKKAGWEVCQFNRPGDHTPVDWLDREQSKDRWALVRRASGFPQTASNRSRASVIVTLVFHSTFDSKFIAAHQSLTIFDMGWAHLANAKKMLTARPGPRHLAAYSCRWRYHKSLQRVRCGTL